MPHQDHQVAQQRARYHLQMDPLFLDTETTGLDPRAEIVEICILKKDGTVLLDTLVKPRKQIPADAIKIHHITNEMVANAPSWVEVWPQIQALLSGKQIGIYNADFDIRMFEQTNRANGIRWNPQEFKQFCIMKLYAQFRGSSHWRTLADAGRQCGLALPNAHRAQADTRLALAIFACIAGTNPLDW